MDKELYFGVDVSKKALDLAYYDGETIDWKRLETVEENFVPEQQTPAGWQVERLILKSPTGDEMEIKCTNLFAVAELLRKMS